MPPGRIEIAYIGGTSETNGLLEAYKPLENDYIMKGYMLRITAPANEPGTPITWTIAGGDFYPGGAWTDYASPLPDVPATSTVYWRSKRTGSIGDSYEIKVKYTPPGGIPVTATRTVKSRQLSPTNPQHRDEFNEDADMAQRAMIQVFFLDKGRLSSYRIGKYDTGQQGWYRSSLPGRAHPQWSPIADEVWNFDKFTLGKQDPSTSLQQRVVEGVWDQFDLILAKPLPNAVTDADVNFDQWVDDAVGGSNMTVPQNFPKTPSDVLKFQIEKESRGRHSSARFNPLAVSSVTVGENLAGSGANLHTYTDDGIGFAKIQPYNWNGINIFGPAENILRQAQIMKTNINGGLSLFPSANEIVWRAYVKYNAGSYFQNSTPAQLRAANNPGALYADDIFNDMGVPPP